MQQMTILTNNRYLDHDTEFRKICLTFCYSSGIAYIDSNSNPLLNSKDPYRFQTDIHRPSNGPANRHPNWPLSQQQKTPQWTPPMRPPSRSPSGSPSGTPNWPPSTNFFVFSEIHSCHVVQKEQTCNTELSMYMHYDYIYRISLISIPPWIMSPFFGKT